MSLHIYEMHIKGLTMLHPDVPVEHRGTFVGATYLIEHIKSLGMNAVQIMPVFKNAGSYWGYDPVDWFEVNPEYGTYGEFIMMCNTFRFHGLKVILDVVYNHLGANHEMDEDQIFYTEEDFAGCGNCIEVSKTLPLIKKSIDKFMPHIDGMRFDLAGVLGRENGKGFDPEVEFFQYMDKYLQEGKILIAEPYDLHEQSYGRYPKGWLELNHHFRDHVRSGNPSSTFKGKANDVNYIACHDGFCLNDVVSYNHKHNEANGENNRDGQDNNLSWNHGHEGFETTNKDILARRAEHKAWMVEQLKQSTANTLWLSGDETVGNTQFGNNNAWNQDNETGWVIWVDWMKK